jgi:hypothetical protein
MTARLYSDSRIGGVRQWSIGDPSEIRMRVPDQILNCVGFLCLKERGRYTVIGNAFFVGTPDNLRPDGYEYIVTARHLVEMGKRAGGLFLRLNTATGKADTVRISGNWVECEDAEGFDTDVVAMRFTPARDDFTYQVLPSYCLIQRHANPQPIEFIHRPFGIGDDLIVPGLFTEHYGTKRNVPIVRFGHVAAMPHEAIKSKKTGLLYEAYLAELRSIGGLSGSPVMLMVDPIGERSSRLRPPTFFLVGLIRGHWSYDVDSSVMNYSEQEIPEASAGISTVTPSEKILDILFGDEMKKQRATEDEERPHFLKDRKDSAKTKEGVGENSPFGRSNFEDALKRASRKIAESQSKDSEVSE